MSKKIISGKGLVYALGFTIIILIIILGGIELWKIFWFSIILSNQWFLMLYYITILIVVVWLGFWIRDTSGSKIKNHTPTFIIGIVVLYYLFRIVILGSSLVGESYFYEGKCSLIGTHYKRQNSYYLEIYDNSKLDFKISEKEYKSLGGYNNNPAIYEMSNTYTNNLECNSEIKMTYLKNSRFILDLDIIGTSK